MKITQKRKSGVLQHITSLPNQYGIGDLGPQTYQFADFLARSKQSYWQLLPLNPPTLKENPYSPYNCLSAFAGNTLLISPELLYRDGLLSKKDLQKSQLPNKGQINYPLVIKQKKLLLDKAYNNFKKKKSNSDYELFCSKNKKWLSDYSLFVAIRKSSKNHLWCDWPAPIRDRDTKAVKSLRNSLADSIEREKFLQYLFFKQWYSLKTYCNKKGIKIIGDIPFYIAYDSTDVWANPQIFKLTKTKKPKFIAGVPPDLFSRTGQLWGNPVYDWRNLKKNNFLWWQERIKLNLSLFDIVRIDHFRGFFAYWQIPAKHKTAKNGKWVKGPSEIFFRKLSKNFSKLFIIAEDLGYITKDVRSFVEKSQLAGMRVLQFAFDKDFLKSVHNPQNHIKNCIVYTGTHDNNTIKGWFRQADSIQKKNLFNYIGHKVSADNIHWEFICMAMASVANTVIIPIQDILGLGPEARMNRPATTKNNWKWRLIEKQITPALAQKLAKLTQLYNRDC